MLSKSSAERSHIHAAVLKLGGVLKEQRIQNAAGITCPTQVGADGWERNQTATNTYLGCLCQRVHHFRVILQILYLTFILGHIAVCLGGWICRGVLLRWIKTWKSWCKQAKEQQRCGGFVDTRHLLIKCLLFPLPRTPHTHSFLTHSSKVNLNWNWLCLHCHRSVIVFHCCCSYNLCNLFSSRWPRFIHPKICDIVSFTRGCWSLFQQSKDEDSMAIGTIHQFFAGLHSKTNNGCRLQTPMYNLENPISLPCLFFRLWEEAGEPGRKAKQTQWEHANSNQKASTSGSEPTTFFM